MTLLKNLALIFVCSYMLNAAPLKVATIGDSHSTVETSFAQSLSTAIGSNVINKNFAVIGATLSDLEAGLYNSKGKFTPKISTMYAYRPDVIIIAFGTNEAIDWTETSGKKWAKSLTSIKHVLTSWFPGATIIVAGPPMGSVGALLQAVNAEREACHKLGLGWVNRYEIMSRWPEADVKKALTKDRIHLTHSGYDKLARLVAARVAELLVNNQTSSTQRPMLIG